MSLPHYLKNSHTFTLQPSHGLLQAALALYHFVLQGIGSLTLSIPCLLTLHSMASRLQLPLDQLIHSLVTPILIGYSCEGKAVPNLW